jgi:hypothetical protein
MRKKTVEATPCQQCQNRKESPLYNVYNPLCLMCGAAGIQSLQRMQLHREAKTQRLQAWLADYVKYGHSEAELRRLAKG